MERRRYLGLAGGLTGGAGGWVLWQIRADLGWIVTSYGPLDLLALATLGGAIGWGVRMATATGRPRLREAAVGAAIGAAGAAGASVIALLLIDIARIGHSAGGFLAARVLLWAFAAGGLGVGLLVVRATSRPASLGPPMLAIVGAGVGAALGLSLPGPSAGYQLVGCMVVGSTVGLFAVGPVAPAEPR